MKNRLESAEAILIALKYLRDDATDGVNSYEGTSDDWSKGQYERYLAQLDAIHCVEDALLKFVKTDK